MIISKRSVWLIFIVLLLGYLFHKINPVVQKEWAAIAAGLNPQRSSQLRQKYESHRDSKLVSLFFSPDPGKRSAASAVLGARNDPKMFDAFVKILHDDNAEARSLARTLLQVDPVRAPDIYMAELEREDLNEEEKDQALRILIRQLKYKPAFEKLVEFSSRDSGNQKASSELFKEFGDPRGIPALEQMLQKSPNMHPSEVKRVKEAIEYLKAQKGVQDANQA